MNRNIEDPLAEEEDTYLRIDRRFLSQMKSRSSFKPNVLKNPAYVVLQKKKQTNAIFFPPAITGRRPPFLTGPFGTFGHLNRNIPSKPAVEVLSEEEIQRRRRIELDVKLKLKFKRVDCYERAKRLEEVPLWEIKLEQLQDEDREYWDLQEEEKIKTAIEERQKVVATRERLARMEFDRLAFLDQRKERKNVIDEASAYLDPSDPTRGTHLSENKPL